VLVGHPSQIKSPPMTEMLRPLKLLDKAAADQFKQDELNYQITKGIHDNAVKAAIKNNNQNPGLVPPPEPKMTRYVVNDSTYEMLIKIADANPDGFLVYRDELSGWFHSLNKDNQKEARGLYLTGWGGTEGYATDRIGRGHVRADRLNLSLMGSIQPNVLREIIANAVNGGAADDGLVQRFQFAVYPDPVTKFVKVDRHPDFAAQQHYEKQVERLVKLDPTSIGASYGPDSEPYLIFDEMAQAVFDNWRDDLETRLRNPDSDDNLAVIAHLGKYRSLFPKIALVLHVADGRTGPIGAWAAGLAAAWVKLLECHARRIYHTASNRRVQSATSLANKIKSGRLASGFTRTDVMLKDWSGLRTADEVGSAIAFLMDMNWIRMVEDKTTRGRPAQRHYINPNLTAPRAEAA